MIYSVAGQRNAEFSFGGTSVEGGAQVIHSGAEMFQMENGERSAS